MKNREINLDFGVGDLSFSMNEKDIINLLGEPNDIDFDDLNDCIAYYYHALNLGVIFVKVGNQFVIDSFELDDESYTLNGNSIYNQSVDNVITMLQGKGFEGYEIHNDDDYKVIIYQNLFIGFDDKENVDDICISNTNLQNKVRENNAIHNH